MKEPGTESGMGSGSGRWLANPANRVEAELREALDSAAARQADEVALRRVWARLAELPNPVLEAAEGREQRQAARARRILWPWILAASLAGATATLAFMLVAAKTESRTGHGEQALASSTPIGASSPGEADGGGKSTLEAPGTVRTGFGETLHLSLRGGAEVIVKSESTLVLDENHGLAVSAGEVEFHVPHQASGQTFAVAARGYRVVVVGTRFRVRVSQTGAAVGVDEGVVEIWTDRRIARIPAGESWISTTPSGSDVASHNRSGSTEVGAVGGSRTGRTTESARPSRGGAQLGSAGVVSDPVGNPVSNPVKKNARRLLALSTPAAPTSTSSSSTGSTAFGADNGWVDPAYLPTDPIPAGLLGEPPSGLTGVTAGATIASAPHRAGMSSTDRERAPQVAPTPAVPADATPIALQARGARAAGDSRRALGLYRTLALRGGAAGEHAEYEIGGILRDSLHQPREAVSAWRSYREQHPRGLLRIEADISVIETLVSMGDTSAAISEASEFIRRYPDSERSAEIARLAGDLLRERGEYVEAIHAYDIALGSAHSRRDIADSASFHRSLCVHRGDEARGLESLRAYIATFPGGRFHGEAVRIVDRANSVVSPH